MRNMRKAHGFGIEYEIVVRDKDGKVVGTRRGRNSLLQNFALLWFQYAMGYSAGLTIVSGTDTTGASLGMYTDYAHSSSLSCLAGAGVDTYGIMVGSGTNAVSPTDYALQTQIAHGSGAGQLDYAGTSMVNPATAGNKRYMDIIRNFTNNSGSDVTFTEIGYAVVAPVTYFFLMARDKLLASVTVPNLGSAQVRYQLSVTV